LNVLFASVEMSPLAKVGGLGDVAGSLPRALRADGVDVRIAMPMHGAVERASLTLNRILQGVEVPWPDGPQRVDVWQAEVRGVPVYLIENARYFGRPTVYGFDDDVERFMFFCDALMACGPHLGFRPDVVHAQDWHTSFLMTRLAATPAHPWSEAGRVYTIHNLGLQGNFDEGFAHGHGIGQSELAPPDGLPWNVGLSGMAQGIMHADRVNTVSDTYAKEILTPEYGAGLDGLLRARSAIVSGIVNGIDYEEFNPQTDRNIKSHFSAASFDGRSANKSALQEEAGVPVNERTLVFGAVTRLFAQKGMDFVAGAFDRLLAENDMQLIILGTGDEAIHRLLLELQEKYASRVRIWLDFDPPLGQRIYAGCDVFLMPSRYEPCGLGQLISLRYGTVPLARRTGGLADTVEEADLKLHTGNGFLFEEPNADGLERAALHAYAAFQDVAGWRELQLRGMQQDWSWGRAAGKYMQLYDAACAARLQERGVPGG
jgi:starch synthase